MTDARMPLPESVDSRQALYLDGARHLFGDTSIRDLLNGANGYSVLALVKSDNFSAERCIWSMSTAASGSINRAGLNLTASGVKVQGRKLDADTTSTATAGYLNDASKWQVYGGTVDYINRRARLYRGGYRVGTIENFGSAVGSGTTITNSRAQNSLLGSNLGAGNFFLGHFDTLLIGPGVWTDAQMWGLTQNIDQNIRPGVLLNRLVLLTGDSISFNSNIVAEADKLYAKLAVELGGNATDYVHSLGVDGATLETLRTTHWARIATDLYVPESSRLDVIGLLHAGTNDLTTDTSGGLLPNGQTVATTLERLTALAAQWKSYHHGMPLGYSLPIARTSVAITAKIRDLIAAVEANPSAYGINALSQWGNNEYFDDGDDPANTTYYETDKIHPKAAGVAIGATNAAACVTALT
jgi:hypothetical protein